MKRTLLLLAPLCGLVVLTAWLVGEPRSAQANLVPEEHRGTLKKGLDYLLKQQHKDGHWETEDGKHTVELTALAGLAMLMRCSGLPESSNDNRKPFREAADKAADWLVDKSQAKRDGLIYSGQPADASCYMAGHGLAMIFLAGMEMNLSYDKIRDDRNAVLEKAVKYVARAQSTQGGWYHTSKVEGHDLDCLWSTVIQLQALQAVSNSRLDYASQVQVISEGQRYLQTAMAKYEKNAKDPRRLADTSAALAVRFLDTKRGSAPDDDELCKKWFRHCEATLPQGQKMKLGQGDLAHFYYAQVGAKCGRENPERFRKNWEDYRNSVYDQLQQQQNKDGSWPGGDGFCPGAVCSTAMWCIVLQLEEGEYPSMGPKYLKTF